MSTPTTPTTVTPIAIDSVSQETTTTDGSQIPAEAMAISPPSADATRDSGALPPPVADIPMAEAEVVPPTSTDTIPAPDLTSSHTTTASESQEVSTDPLQIPKELEVILPLSTDSIVSLLTLNLPEPIGVALAKLTPARSCITEADVCWSLEALSRAPIPPAKWLGDLEVHINRRIRDEDLGISLAHPTIQDLRLPPWGITFWRRAMEARTEKDSWTAAQKWVQGEANKGMDITTVQGLMARTTWNMPVWAIDAGRSTVGLLSTFLTTKWLAERHFDLFATYLTALIGTRAEEWWIGGTYLAVLLKALPKTKKINWSAKNRGGLNDFQTIVTTKDYKHLLFPANIEDNHWIAVYVNIKEKTFCYGDSLNKPSKGADILKLRNGLGKWLARVFGGAFSDKGQTLSIGKQEDGYSCGICVLNSMEHAVCRVPLFSHANRHTLRITYFTKLMGYLLQDPFPEPSEDRETMEATTTQEQPALLPKIMITDETGTDNSATSDLELEPAPFASNAGETTETHVAGQAFQSLTFDGERAIVNVQWGLKLLRKRIQCRKILSKSAKAHILNALTAGAYKSRSKAVTPPHMAPSPNPADYSNWCSICEDFGTLLVLCSRCRVSICVKSQETSVGCAKWDPIIEDPTFIYICPWCATQSTGLSMLQLIGDTPLPNKRYPVFRYDPPVLVVSLTWHGLKAAFCDSLYQQLKLGYYNNEEDIRLLEVLLDGSRHGRVNTTQGVGRVDANEAGTFLDTHPTAKIIIIIDAHCLENGAFVWTGNDPVSFQGCYMPELLRDCIPKEVRRFVLSKYKQVHHHRSIIFNLSCGPSVQVLEARAVLCTSHCADAVISLANTSTVVAKVSSTLAEFATEWAQTSSEYDLLFARNVTSHWATRHRPVVSCRVGSAGQSSHTLYTGFQATEPNGLIARCNHWCGVENREHSISNSSVKIICNRCRSYCTFDRVKQGKATALDNRSLVKTSYPQGQARLTWLPLEPPAPEPAQKKSKSGRVKAPTPTPAKQLQEPSPPTTGPSEQPPKSNAPVIAPSQQSHASWPVHLELPTILTRSASLPTNQASRPTRPIPSPAPATVASPVVPPTTPLGPQPSLPSRLTIRIPSINPDPPQMIRSISAPEQGTLKRANYPVLDVETIGRKRQKKK